MAPTPFQIKGLTPLVNFSISNGRYTAVAWSRWGKIRLLPRSSLEQGGGPPRAGRVRRIGEELMRLTRVALGTVALGLISSAMAPTWLEATTSDVSVSVESVDAQNDEALPPTDAPVTLWRAPEGATLYDNGPLVTNPGACTGIDASRLQAGNNSLGATAQIAGGIRMADNFTVPPGTTWNVNQITVFAYQTGSTQVSTFTDMRLQIWNGQPNVAGSAVIFGNTTTNRLASTAFTNGVRDSVGTPCPAAANQQRPIMSITANAAVTLGPGTYWIDYTLGGSGALTGPFSPLTSIAGSTTGCVLPNVCNS